MNTDTWKEVERLFFKLVDLGEDERVQELSVLEQEKPALYKEVYALLQEEESLHPLLQTGPTMGWQGWEDINLVGQHIGIYRLTTLLGSGGMGSVFLADRADGNFEQTVALKLVREGVYHAQNEQDFLQERQILAKLQHPHIAQLLDGGVYGENRPYYTMEYIEGLPLDEYCQEHNLGIAERLALFCQVCEAIHYAHSQLILHLDIKPSNILVDTQGQVKLLDFGIAQLFSPIDSLSHQTNSTGKSYTLAYAAPEQLNGTPLSTATDIYSLGVVLFQLLTGNHPFQVAMTDREQLRSHLLHQTAPLPSQQLLAGLPYRKNEIPKDVDEICLHALEKLPQERYSSAQALKEDIIQVVEQRPISLREREWSYVLGKYMLRNKAMLSLLLIGLMSLFGVSVYYTWQLKQERDLATREALKSQRIAALLSDMFTQANPNVSLGKEPTASELLQQGLSEVKEKLIGEPEMLAEMYQVMGGVYMDRAEYPQADTLLTAAVHLLDSLDKAPSLERAEAYHKLGALKYRQSAYDQSRMANQLALALASQLPKRSPELISQILLEWANLESEVGNYSLSDSLMNELLRQTSQRPLTDSVMADVQMTLGINARKVGAYERANTHYQEALLLRKKLYPYLHPERAYVLNHLSSLYQNQGKYEEALPLADSSYVIRKQIFGAKHPETIASLSNVSRIHNALGNFMLARGHYEEMYGLLKEIYGYPHPYLGAVKGNIANTYLKEGKSSLAVPLFEEALDITRQSLPPDHIRLGLVYNNYGAGLLEDESYEEGEKAFRQALDIREKGLPPDHTDIGLTKKGLGFCLLYQGKNEEGRKHLLAALEILMKDPDTYSAELAEIEEGLGVRGVGK